MVNGYLSFTNTSYDWMVGLNHHKSVFLPYLAGFNKFILQHFCHDIDCLRLMCAASSIPNHFSTCLNHNGKPRCSNNAFFAFQTFMFDENRLQNIFGPTLKTCHWEVIKWLTLEHVRYYIRKAVVLSCSSQGEL